RRRARAEPDLADRGPGLRAAGADGGGRLPGGGGRPLRHVRRNRLAPLHGDLRTGLPLRAVPDELGAAGGHPQLRRAARSLRLPRRDPLVPHAARLPRGPGNAGRPVSPAIWRLVGFLAAVEIASGVLQGYYTPVYSDIADHLVIADGDVNWFEAA